MLALGVKLYFFSTYITKVTWSDQYANGITCGYLSAAFVFLPLLFVRKHKNKLAIIVALFFACLLLIDTVYYSYYDSLPTIGLLNIIGQADSQGPAILGLLRLGYLWYFADVILALVLIKPIGKLIKRLKDRYSLNRANVIGSWAVVIVILAAFLMSLAPVGEGSLNIAIDKGYDTATSSQYYGILVAHAVDIIRFVEQETAHLSKQQEKSLVEWVKNNKPAQTTDSLSGIAKGKNIIVIQVESLGGFVINQKINDKEVTPTLDKLASQSQFFPNDQFLLGAGHTSDTDFVANTSYFPLSDAAIFVRFGRDNFTGLPKALIPSGYSAYAYHGFTRNFWNRDVALKSLGYQMFYAADNYPKGEIINMGLNDGDFLSKTAEYIKNQPKPSLSYVITLSSHVPFATTDKSKALGINRQDYDDQVGGYMETINYTDRMLGKFFEKLKSENLYDDSLILVYGDHTPVLPAFSIGTIKYDPETVQAKEVPLIIKLPNYNIGKTFEKQGTHIDIMPTILDLVGIKTNQLMFGQSLFASSDKALKVCSNQLIAFPTKGGCKTMLTDEKDKSATIIRYNQFNNL